MGSRVLREAFAFNNKLIFTGMAVFALLMQPVYAVAVGQTANAAPGSVITISTDVELRAAIEGQEDNQTWNIQPGNYAVTPTSAVLAGGQTGWYFPITANGLTINGIGNPTIYGGSYAPNGNWSTQNLVSVFGDNVTINGLILMPKVQPNKTLEVLGSNFTLRNTTFSPNTLVDGAAYDNIADAGTRAWAKQWGGSLYFSHEGNHTIENVTINNGGVSYRYAPTGTNITLTNVKIVNATNDTAINTYRYSTGFNNSGNTVSNPIQVIYRVSSALNNLSSVLASMQNTDIIELDSDLATTQQITLNKSVAMNGNGHTITANFIKTDGANNAVIGVQADGVVIKDVNLDGVNPVVNMLHGINVYQSNDVFVDGVSAKNFRTGIVYNGSTGTIQNVHTMNNVWHGINIDKLGADVNVLGTNTHTEGLNIYVDDMAGVTVNAPAYDYSHPAIEGRLNDRVYRLRPAIVDGDTDNEMPASPTDGLGGETPQTSTITTTTETITTTTSVMTPVFADNSAAADEEQEQDIAATSDETGIAGEQDAEKSWSLVNVLLAIAATILSVVAVMGIRKGEEDSRFVRLITIVPAVAAIGVVLLTEDFSAKLGWFNSWTLLLAVIVIAQVALFANSSVGDKE